MDKQLKSELVHLLVTYCSAINNLEEYLARLIEKESVELFSFNKEYIKTIWKVSDYKCSTCDLGKWSHTSEGPSDARQQRAVCKLCQSLYDRITDKHALKSPNWANVEWQLIMIEPLQHMKCYIKEYGHREVRMVRQLGLSALIQICLNHCDLKTLFGNALPFLEQISEKQDQVFQSETLHIGEDDLNTHLRKIEDVLKIVCGGTDMDITSHTMSAKIFNAGQQQFTVEDELKTKLKIIQTLDRRIHSLKCWQTLYGNSQDDQELQKLLFIKNLHCQKLQERNQQLASNTHGKIQRYEKQKQVLKNYTDEINKISTDNSSHYCESGMMSDLTVQSPHDKYNQTLLEETHDNVIEALENTHTNKNGIETAICLLRDIHDKFDACSAGIFLVPGTSKEEGFRSVAQTDSKSYLDSRKIIRNINRPMETDTPGEVSTTTKARLIQSPSGLNTQEPVNGQKRSLKRPYQCLESECPKVTVTPNLQAIRTESPNSFNSTETVPEHISLLERPLQYLEEGGNTICRINHECMAFYLSCPNVLNVINLCEDVLNGKVEALFLPLQNYLRTQPDCNNVSVVVDISGNDFTKCIMPCLIKLNRQLDSRIQQLENPYKQNNKASTAAGNTDMKTAISMFKDLIDHHPSVNCETPSELRLTVDTLGVEDSHTLTRHLVDAANELQRHKKNAKYRETLQRTDQHKKNGIETAISIFKGLKGQIPFIDETSELRLNVEVIGVMDGHSLTRQIFDAAIELHSTEETKTSHSQELRQYLQHVFQYLKKGGNALNIRETDCSAFYICCPTLANAMTLCEDFITGKVEALFQPLQGYLKTLPECQDVSIVVDISESDFVNCILPSLTAIKRQLDSWVPAQGPDSRGSVAVSKYADKGIESCTSNKQDSSFDGQFSVHPWDRLISHLCEEFSVEDSDFENFLLGSKTRIGDDNYNRIQSLDGRSGQKYHALFDCLERKFGQHDSVEFLLHLTATLNFHSDSACVTYTTAFEQYKQDIEELHLTTKGLVMEPSCKIVDILQKRPYENVSSYERHPKGVVLWGPLGKGMTRFLNQILWRLRFGSFTTSIVRQWNIVAVNQRDKTEVKELSSNMINNIRKEMGMEDIIFDFISVNDQKQNLMSLLKDLGKRKGDYLVLLDDMDGHFKHEHSPCEQFLTDVMDTIAEVDNIKIIMTVSKSVSKSNAIDSFGGKLVFAGHMLEFNLTEEILTENIPIEEILMPKISSRRIRSLEDQEAGDCFGAFLYTYVPPSGKKFKFRHILKEIADGYPAHKIRISEGDELVYIGQTYTPDLDHTEVSRKSKKKQSSRYMYETNEILPPEPKLDCEPRLKTPKLDIDSDDKTTAGVKPLRPGNHSTDENYQLNQSDINWYRIEKNSCPTVKFPDGVVKPDVRTGTAGADGSSFTIGADDAIRKEDDCDITVLKAGDKICFPYWDNICFPHLISHHAIVEPLELYEREAAHAVKIILIGKMGVGKTSLINALLGRKQYEQGELRELETQFVFGLDDLRDLCDESFVLRNKRTNCSVCLPNSIRQHIFLIDTHEPHLYDFGKLAIAIINARKKKKPDVHKTNSLWYKL